MGVWNLLACCSTLLGMMGRSMEVSFIWCLGMSMDLSICFSGLPVLSSLRMAFTSLKEGTYLSRALPVRNTQGRANRKDLASRLTSEGAQCK